MSIQKSKNKRKVLLIVLILLLIVLTVFLVFKVNYDKAKELEENMLKQEQLKDKIIAHYNNYVITNKDIDFYELIDGKYTKVGKISKDEELTLEEQEITYKDEYFKINNFDGKYYVYYEDVEVVEELSSFNNRYKRYIVFNQNIVTNENTRFYDETKKLIYTLPESYELPIVIKKKDMYGVEFNDRLLYVMKEDVKETKESKNTTTTNTKGVAVLNYHFFYDDALQSERNDCNQIICHSKSGFKKQLDYIKNNNIFTLTMNEFEMYMNKEINLPTSVLITIDDGWRMNIGIQMLNEYKLNATVFLITSWFKEIEFLNDLEYIEYHSHGDNLHNQGECPGGQGGAIKCWSKTKLLQDLSTSRNKLNGSTAFCYPFYEYNNYSISVLKEAGFTLAFGGGMQKATLKTDKYQIPRYVMYDYTSVEQLKQYIN